MVVGITTRVTTASRQPIASAIVAGDLHTEVGRDQPALQAVHTFDDVACHHHGIRAGALGKRQADGRNAIPPRFASLGRRGQVPHPGVRRAGADHHPRHVAHVDRPAVARGQQQQADIRHAAQGLPGRQCARHAGIAHGAGDERAVGVAHLADELLQRHAE